LATIPIYTIGYGNRSIEEFIALLQRYGIQYLVDIRSQPHSRFNPNFSQKALQQHLKQHDIGYIFMGEQLGGRPAEEDCYNEDDTVNYEKLAEKPFYQSGIERIQTAYTKQLCVVLMCSELKPTECHRGKLIGDTLTEKGIEVKHIDEVGEITSHDVVRQVLDSKKVNNDISQGVLPGLNENKKSSRKAYPNRRKGRK
jgi:uncharacterized protein (DUF488 family)